MMKVQSIVEDVLIASGIGVSLVNIQQFLSILLLAFNIVWILTKMGIKIYEKIKNKQYKDIPNDIKNAKDELETLSDSIKDDSGKNK